MTDTRYKRTIAKTQANTLPKAYKTFNPLTVMLEEAVEDFSLAGF